jgi:hypothetical protein
MKIRTLLMVAFVVLATPALSLALPCVPNSLQNYILLAAGCEIDGASVFGFGSGPSFAGGTAIDPSTITVVPEVLLQGIRLNFLMTASAGPGDITGTAIGYSLGGLSFTNALLSVNGSSALGDGVMTAILDLCQDDVFVSDPSNCLNPPPVTLVFAHDFLFGPTGPDQKPVTASSLAVFLDITVDGGLAGAAALGGAGGPGTVINEFTASSVPQIPEPSTVVLVGSGLLAFWVGRRYRRTQRKPTASGADKH